MNVKEYYQRVREVAARMPEDAVIIRSLATANGGKAGVLTEVSRQIAATEIVNGTATLATAEESAAYYREMDTKRQMAEKAQALTRLHLSLTTATPILSSDLGEVMPETGE